jgi:hypothetical protein
MEGCFLDVTKGSFIEVPSAAKMAAWYRHRLQPAACKAETRALSVPAESRLHAAQQVCGFWHLARHAMVFWASGLTHKKPRRTCATLPKHGASKRPCASTLHVVSFCLESCGTRARVHIRAVAGTHMRIISWKSWICDGLNSPVCSAHRIAAMTSSSSILFCTRARKWGDLVSAERGSPGHCAPPDPNARAFRVSAGNLALPRSLACLAPCEVERHTRRRRDVCVDSMSRTVSKRCKRVFAQKKTSNRWIKTRLTGTSKRLRGGPKVQTAPRTD